MLGKSYTTTPTGFMYFRIFRGIFDMFVANATNHSKILTRRSSSVMCFSFNNSIQKGNAGITGLINAMCPPLCSDRRRPECLLVNPFPAEFAQVLDFLIL